MINSVQLQEAIEAYKADFSTGWWEEEQFKWKAIRCFQENWDIEAEDFPEMLNRALAETGNLLVSVNHYPAGMIRGFAQEEPEEVRSMFRALFDEKNDVVERITAFKEKSAELLKKGNSDAKNHYQDENSITVYLWLKYPDKYYIYKFGEAKAAAARLESGYTFIKGHKKDNVKNFFNFYDELCGEIKKDSALLELFRSHLTPDCYPDPEYRTLATDIGFYISQKSENKGKYDVYWPSHEEYDPNLSKDDWKQYLTEVELPENSPSIKMLKAMLELGGEATCKELAQKYGGHPTAYVGYTVNLGKKVKEHFDLPPCMEGVNDRMFAIPFLGRYAGKKEAGVYSYKIRPELHEALLEMDLSAVDPHYGEKPECGYWWLNANPALWSLSSLGAGESWTYSLYNENGNKRRIFQNFLDAKVGDKVIGYISTPVKQVAALCEISAEQNGKEIGIRKLEDLSSPIDISVLKACPELSDMEYFVNPQGSLFRMTKEEYNFILDIIREANPIYGLGPVKHYDETDFLREVYMSRERYDALVSVLRRKKNVILQGAPGVGKTYAAKRLAYSMMGEENDDRIEFVQFHQNYSYEDFVMGYKPTGDGFELKKGVFYRFCRKAANHPDTEYFFIIDEINRGNLSRIFGELLMLIEKDYRGKPITLAYDGLPFAVPENLYIIGMMNTADRSLAMIDYALRRRFSFFDMEPGFDSDGFKKHQQEMNSKTFDAMIEKVKDLNREIMLDKTLGNGFCIGHSYFCEQKTYDEEWLKGIVEFDLLPTLKEYWFDSESKWKDWEEKLRGVFQG